jgi:transposase
MVKVHSQHVRSDLNSPKETFMNKVEFYVGIDISSKYFTVSILTAKTMKAVSFDNFENSINGFQSLLSEFQSQKIKSSDCIVCMEATGVYGENLAYFLISNNFLVAIENPLKVKRAFDISPKKTDKIDSKRIAEYAYRFVDELEAWTPKSQIIEEIRIFLAQREQFTVQKTANTNARKALEKKFYRSEKAIQMYMDMTKKCDENIKSIDKEILALIEKEPEYRQAVANITTIPGVGNILAFHILAVTNGFQEHMDFKELASYAGIVPLPFESGSSVRKKTASSGIGPGKIRKLLFLASMSSRTYNKSMRDYFLRKVAEGKNKRLVLNNIGNKLLKLTLALVKNRKPYIENFVSINPIFLKNN